jgi:hypothetical protein
VPFGSGVEWHFQPKVFPGTKFWLRVCRSFGNLRAKTLEVCGSWIQIVGAHTRSGRLVLAIS